MALGAECCENPDCYERESGQLHHTSMHYGSLRESRRVAGADSQ